MKKRKYTKYEPRDCPFCGAFNCSAKEWDEMTKDEFNLLYAVVCNTCSCTGPFAEEEDYAWDLWNNRGEMNPLCPQEH